MLNVCVTGAAGFIGGVLAKQCTEAGALVLGLDIAEPDAGWGALPSNAVISGIRPVCPS